MNLSAFVSHVATAYEFNYLEAERSKLVTPFGRDIANGVINNPSDGFTDNERTESYIANVTTDFKNKYFLNATFNRDASSRFINTKWGNFLFCWCCLGIDSRRLYVWGRLCRLLKSKSFLRGVRAIWWSRTLSRLQPVFCE